MKRNLLRKSHYQVIKVVLYLVYFLAIQHSTYGQTAAHPPACTDCKPILILSHDTVSFLKWVRQQESPIEFETVGKGLFRVKCEEDVATKLEHAPGVKHAERRNRIAKEETVLGNFDITSCGVQAAHASFPDLNGEALTLSVKEKSLDPQDVDLRGRVKINNHFGPTASLHATIMATIAAGAGNSSSHARGVASNAFVTSSDFDNLLPDNPNELAAQQVSVQNHSYGVGVENHYGIESMSYDQAAIDFPKVFHVFSSGNQGDQPASEGKYAGLHVANLTGQFKIAKNVLTVGTVDRFGNLAPLSSRGPAHDGRIKPELVAYGDGGSSESAALVSGAVLLLQHGYKSLRGELPDGALIRALLISSAEDAGREGIDFETGFGIVNVKRALSALINEQFMAGTLEKNEIDEFEIVVPTGKPNLKVTLAWADPAAEPSTEHSLINDLDLKVTAPDGTEIMPWVLDPTASMTSLTSPPIRGADTLNNVEQITWTTPAAGSYHVSINGQLKTSSQKYFIVFDTGIEFQWQHPVAGSFLRAGETNVLRWSSDFESPGTLFYQRVASSTWTAIGEVDLSDRSFAWDAPAQTGNVRFKMISQNSEFVSEVVPVSIAPTVSVGFNCEDSVMLWWHSDEQATAYQLYRLGERNLEALSIVADTFAIVSKNDINTDALAVASIYDTHVGNHEGAIYYAGQGVGCYFISALPRIDISSPIAVIDVLLGTTFNLASAKLEWMDNGEWKVVNSITPPTSASLSLTHDSPRNNENIYRVKLLTKDDRAIVSQEISILIVGEEDLLIYPNPAGIGQEVNLIVNSEEAMLISVHDSKGALARKFDDYGAVKTFDTTELSSGLYIIQATKANGNVLSRRLVIK